ncbi:MAG TPA: DsrE family protein [Candidatus Baltobacteraceae bacterium]|nr:DsrE family protein [Candidatus Baltobacteraceae bacterium]
MARHRQVFGAHGTDMTSLFEEMNAALDAYAGALDTLAVLYGAATPAAVAGAVWRTYRLGARLNVDAHENPFAARIVKLQARGAKFVVCGNSLRGLAIAIANGVLEVQEPVDSVLDRMRANLVRGVETVPAGVAALNAAQEAGYTYLPVSL